MEKIAERVRWKTGKYSENLWNWREGGIPESIVSELLSMNIDPDDTVDNVLIGIINNVAEYLKERPYLERYTQTEFAEEFDKFFPAEAFGPASEWDEGRRSRFQRILQTKISHDPELAELWWGGVGKEKQEQIHRERREGIRRRYTDEDEIIEETVEKPVKYYKPYSFPEGFVINFGMFGDVYDTDVTVSNINEFDDFISKLSRKPNLKVSYVRIMSPKKSFDESSTVNQLIDRVAQHMIVIFGVDKVYDEDFKTITGRNVEFTQEDKKAVMELAEEGYSEKEIADLINLDEEVIGTLFKMYGIGKAASLAVKLKRLADCYDESKMFKKANRFNDILIMIHCMVK